MNVKGIDSRSTHLKLIPAASLMPELLHDLLPPLGNRRHGRGGRTGTGDLGIWFLRRRYVVDSVVQRC